MADFHRVLGKKTHPLTFHAAHSLCADKSGVLIDLGTGKGIFVLEAAKENPNHLVIGIDAVAENMVPAARKALASLKKGGLPNAVFVRGAAERLPGPFAGCADALTVQYPWGSLMRIVAEPSELHLHGLRALCKTGASLSVYLNYSVFEDREYLDRLGMSDIVDPAHAPNLAKIYMAAGFTLTRREVIDGDPPIRSSWGRHLVRGSARTTLILEAIAQEQTAQEQTAQQQMAQEQMAREQA